MSGLSFGNAAPASSYFFFELNIALSFLTEAGILSLIKTFVFGFFNNGKQNTPLGVLIFPIVIGFYSTLFQRYYDKANTDSIPFASGFKNAKS